MNKSVYQKLEILVERFEEVQALLSDHHQQVKLSSVDVNSTTEQDKAAESAK